MSATPPGTAASGSGDAFADAHRALLADRTIQFELETVEVREVPQSEPWSIGMPGATILFWVVIAAVASFLLYAIANRLSGARWDRWRRAAASSPEQEEQDWRPEPGPARRLLGEADSLAAQGRYAEAAHLLLFRSIDEIDARRPAAVRPALTSRDIAALPALPPAPRRAFSRIVMAVEHSLFGRRPLGPDDWRDCREAYEAFAFAEGWRG